MAGLGMPVCGVLKRAPGSTSPLPPHPLACPGGASHPCSDHGLCMDGMSGSGQCRCHSGFAGTACELCAPGAFGPLCQGRLFCLALPCLLIPLANVPTPSSCRSLSPACRCTSHGHCDEGLGGSGSCFCDEGWTGPRCEVQLGEWPLCCAHPAHTSALPTAHSGGGTEDEAGEGAGDIQEGSY